MQHFVAGDEVVERRVGGEGRGEVDVVGRVPYAAAFARRAGDGRVGDREPADAVEAAAPPGASLDLVPGGAEAGGRRDALRVLGRCRGGLAGGGADQDDGGEMAENARV